MKRHLSLALLCGLLLLAAHTPVRAQSDMNPSEELAKFSTPAQKKKLDAIKNSLDQKLVAKLGAFQADMTKKLYSLAMNPTYQPQFTEAEKLSEPEQSEKKKEIWKKIAEEIRPSSEKEISALIRGLITGFFTDAEKLMTVAQKPKFVKVRTRMMGILDKELPKSVSSMYDSFIPVKE